MPTLKSWGGSLDSMVTGSSSCRSWRGVCARHPRERSSWLIASPLFGSPGQGDRREALRGVVRGTTRARSIDLSAGADCGAVRCGSV